MNDEKRQGGGNISVGGNVSGSVISSGDNNQITMTVTQSDHADICQQLDGLQQILAALDLPEKERGKIERAFGDAKSEAKDKQPDKEEVAEALERALKYAKKAEGFAAQVVKLKPYAEAIGAWLGANRGAFLGLLGL